MPLLPLAALFALIALVCASFLVRHAFQRSVGTGLLVLLLGVAGAQVQASLPPPPPGF